MYNIGFLEEKAKEIRKSIISMITEAKSGHPGGSLSATDILTSLYFSEMNIDPDNPKMPDRDRFVLSKGHAAPAIYATLAERGYFPKEDSTCYICNFSRKRIFSKRRSFNFEKIWKQTSRTS